MFDYIKKWYSLLCEVFFTKVVNGKLLKNNEIKKSLLDRYNDFFNYKISEKLWNIYGARHATKIIVMPVNLNVSKLTSVLIRLKIALYEKKAIKTIPELNDMQPIRLDKIFLTNKNTYGEDETQQYLKLIDVIKQIHLRLSNVSNVDDLSNVEHDNYNIAMSVLYRLEPIFIILIQTSREIEADVCNKLQRK